MLARRIACSATAWRVWFTPDARRCARSTFTWRLGEPVDGPWTGVQVRLPAGVALADVEREIRQVVDTELARLPVFRTELIRGEHPVC